MKVGITGASGVLGRHLTSENQQFEWYPFSGDITNLESIIKWASGAPQLDAIIHLAAIVAVSRADASPDYATQVNVGGVENLIKGLQITNRLEKIWFFFSSSAHVYKSSNNFIRETDEVEPISFYGQTKLKAEIKLQHSAKELNFQYCIGRIFSYTSPLQSKEFVIPGLCEKIKLAPYGGTVEIRGGNNIRDFLTAEKVAKIIRRLTLQKETGIINIGSGNMFSIEDVAKEIQRQLNRSDLTIKFMNGNSSKLIADISKLKDVSCHYSITLTELIAHYIEDIENKIEIA
jgi:nucleoside-diphosphate-sugar epimerase